MISSSSVFAQGNSINDSTPSAPSWDELNQITEEALIPSALSWDALEQSKYSLIDIYGCENSNEESKAESIAKLIEFINKTPKNPYEELIFENLIFKK